MSSYFYEAVDIRGAKLQGALVVTDQNEALRRIREMGLFPTRISERPKRAPRRTSKPGKSTFETRKSLFSISIRTGGVRTKSVAIFTRQLATLVDAGMPLLRGLRTLQEQEGNAAMKTAIGGLAASIESGCTLSEALASYPKAFNHLYINMVKAGELSGALELTLTRLAEFMEKARRIRSKVRAAMFYPSAVMFVAVAILAIMMTFVVPRFEAVFSDLLNGASLPTFTLMVLNTSHTLTRHLPAASGGLLLLVAAGAAFRQTRFGRRTVDRLKLRVPLTGPVLRKMAVGRFARTLGTLLSSGVPILPALTILRDTAGNVIIGNAISAVHDSVKEGGTIAEPLKASGVFPVMVAGMVDVGEQTGALPDMLLKIADTYDEEVDTAVGVMTSLLEPIMIVFLAVVVGSIVIALFLPIIAAININAGGTTAGTAE